MMKFALFTASAFLTISICEVLVRIALPQQLIIERPDVWYPVEGPGWRKRAGVDTTVNTGERDVRLRTDEQGFRIGSADRRLADINLLLLGDSFTEAIQVEYEDSLAGLLELRLAESLDTTVAVWNTAVSGWGPSQYLIQAQEILAQQRFDLVLVALYLGNDAEADRTLSFPARAFIHRHPLRWPREASWKEFVRAVLRPTNDLLERQSHLFQLIKVQQRALLMRLGLSARYFPTELLESSSMEEAWQGTAATMRAIVDLATSHRVPTRIVVLPSHYQLDEAALEQYLTGFGNGRQDVDVERPNRLLADAARAKGVELTDATSALAAARGAGQRVFGRVDTHLSPAGHAVVADLLLPELDQILRSRLSSAASPGLE